MIAIEMMQALDQLGDQPAEHDRGARDRRRAQLVEVAALDVLDQEQRRGAERRRQQQRLRQLEGAVALAFEELRRGRREDLARLADVDDEEEERDEERGDDRLRRPPRLAQRALPEHPGLHHAVTSCTSPAPRARSRPVASRNTSSSVGSLVRREPLAQLVLELLRRALAHDHAAVDDRQAIAQLVGLLEVLRGEEDGRALLVDALHLVPDGQAAGGVQAGGGLVEEQHLGPVHERAREVQPALHAAAVALDAAVGGVLELDQREQLLGPLGRLARGHPEQPRLQDQQLAAVLARVQPGLLQRDADLVPRRVRVAGDVDARDLGACRS